MQYLIDRDSILYIQSYAFREILVHFKDNSQLIIDCWDEDNRNKILDSIN